jgi:hypothetical protein
MSEETKRAAVKRPGIRRRPFRDVLKKIGHEPLGGPADQD